MIGVAVGPIAVTIPRWRRERGAVHPNVVHAVAKDWPGPACNLGRDPAVKRVVGWLIDAPAVTCGACRELFAVGGAR